MSRLRSVRACIRVGLLGFGVAAVTVILVLGRARGAVDDTLIDLGGALMSDSWTPPEGHRTLNINGNLVHFSVHTVDGSLEDVIRRRVADCNERDGELGETLTRSMLAQLPVDRLRWLELRDVATTSFQGPGRGYVACLDLGEAHVPIPNLVARFRRFSETGRLHALGALRFVFAQPVADAPATTLVLTAWADELDVRTLLSAGPLRQGEGAFLDFGSPPGVRLVLTATESGGTSAVVVYLAEGTTTEHLLRFYAEAFDRAGYKRIGGKAVERLAVDASVVVGAERDGEVVTLVARPTGPESTTLVVLRTDAR
ncbi:MAG: hypothetical protein AAF500_16590 [Myxococcota bacterium]